MDYTTQVIYLELALGLGPYGVPILRRFGEGWDGVDLISKPNS